MTRRIPFVFPPELVRVVCEGGLVDVDADTLTLVVNTVFFASFELNEGSYNPVRVLVVRSDEEELVVDGGGGVEGYRWKFIRFATPRAFDVSEVVKLATATAHEAIYVACLVEDEPKIVGLAREGTSTSADPFVEVIARAPGKLAIERSRRLLVEYNRGRALVGSDDPLLTGIVLAKLWSFAPSEDASAYVDSIRSLVRQIVERRRGGIVVIDPDLARTEVTSAYEMAHPTSVAAFLRLSARVGAQSSPFARTLRSALSTEAARIIEEIAVLAAIDGATILTRDLGLVAFGAVLPIDADVALWEARDPRAVEVRPITLGHKGTRHRAAATYARHHPDSVVFVVSEDGRATCMMRDGDRNLAWSLDGGGA